MKKCNHLKLKIKLMEWSAGLPVVMINEKTATELGVHSKDRILIKFDGKELSTIVDTVKGFVKQNEIAVSSELKQQLGLKIGQKVCVTLAPTPKSMFLIKKKLDGKRLSNQEINEIIKDIVSNSLSEVEVALFVTAVYEKGMSFMEEISLIRAILKTGQTLKLYPKKSVYIVDKHCIGGIPGNRTTPIVVSICAAGGLIMPKSSSKAITSPAGTADVIETVAEVDFSIDQIRKIIKKTNACMVWGGALGMVPADSKIIKVEKVLKIDPRAQLLASIMSKKLALGSKYLLIDIPYGKYAKVSKAKALVLKKEFQRLGKYFRKKMKIVLTHGDQPIGNGIGPSLELIDVIKILDPIQKGPRDLREKSLFLAGEIFELTKVAKSGKGVEMAQEILNSGKAFEKFKQIIEAQNGSLDRIKTAKFHKDIFAKKSGKVKEVHNKKISSLARVAGCPVDKSSGLYLYVHLNDKVKKGDKLLTIYSESNSRITEAVKYYNNKKPIILR